MDYLKQQPMCKNYSSFLDFMNFAAKVKPSEVPALAIKSNADLRKLQACIHPDKCIGHEAVCTKLTQSIDINEDGKVITVDRRGFLESVKQIAREEVAAASK